MRPGGGSLSGSGASWSASAGAGVVFLLASSCAQVLASSHIGHVRHCRPVSCARVIGAPCDVSMPQSVVFPLTVWIRSGSVFGSVFMAVSFVGCVVALFVVMWVMTTNMTTNR